MKDAKILEKELSKLGKLQLVRDLRGNDGNKFARASFWNVRGKGLILLAYGDGTAGLYQLVGEDGDSVVKDLQFIKSI